MCGIFIAIRSDNQSQFSAENCERATHCTSHRGPDNIGFFNDDTCFMGHNRLSILGLEKESNQPFEFDNYVMVFNGEIFNYVELKEQLINLVACELKVDLELNEVNQ